MSKKKNISKKNKTETKEVKDSGFGFKKLFYWVSVLSIWGVIGLVLFGVYLTQDLPELDSLPPPGQNNQVEIRDINGEILATYGAIYGETLPFDAIPKQMIEAIISIEDRRFFEHGALDFRGIARALYTNISKGTLSQGASTITQQLAKNIYLSFDRTLERKARELLLAFWLEQRFTKKEIIALYLNRVYFGSGTYGIDSASRKYFGHSARSLSVQEAALLAGLVKAPSRYAPTRSIKTAQGRAGVVLMAMNAAGYLTKSEAESYSEKPAELYKNPTGKSVLYFTDWIMAQLEGKVTKGVEPLIVHTSLDLSTQKLAEKSIRDHLDSVATDANIGEASLVSIALDGSIKAMVGGRDYAKSQFNRVTQAKRQSGSSFKTFVYLAGLENGLKPTSVYKDEAIDIEGWSPQNFSGKFSGNMSIREAFARSINTVAVKVSEEIGREKVIKVAHKLGIQSNVHTQPSLALGTSLITSLEMVTSYGSIANGGIKVTPYAILEIRSLKGDLMYRKIPPENEAVVPHNKIKQLVGMMEGVVKIGSARSAQIDRPAAGKSGTSQDYKDAWFIGFTSELITAVWLGNDNGSPMLNVTGGGMPSRIWASFMKGAHKNMPVRDLLADYNDMMKN